MYAFGDDFAYNRVRWLEFNNTTGVQVPAFAVMRISDYKPPTANTSLSKKSEDILSIFQPSTFGSQHLHYINGPTPVDNNAFGLCTNQWPAWALYDQSDGTPVIGDFWGPRNATWKLKKSTGGFRIAGTPDTTNFIVPVVQAPMYQFYGKNTGSQVAKGSPCAVNVYTGTFGSETDSGVQLTALARLGPIPANAMLICSIDFTSLGNAVPNWYALETDTCPS